LGSTEFSKPTRLFSAGRQEVSVMRSLLRTFSLGLVFSLLIVPSDAAVNSGRSPVVAQSVSVVNPGANQTPDPGQGGLAVSSQTNTGHGSETSSAFRATKGVSSKTKTCLWYSFPGVPGTKTRVTLKFDCTLNASIHVDGYDDFVSATAEYDFRIEYSLDNGSTWTVRSGVSDSVSIDGLSSDGRSINTSGSESVDLPNPGAIDITQIRVRDRIFTSAALANSPDGSASSLATASVSYIRLEVETAVGANCIATVPGNRWKGEYFNGITPTGSPAMVRDDGADDFLNFNFGDGGPGGNCGLGVDNFSARWTRMVNFAPGIYRFSVTGDDGVRLYVDGQLKINKWFSQGATTYTADVPLSSAGAHEVKLEYFESGGSAVALLSWTLVAGLSCLPDVPLIGATPGAGGGENIATTAISGLPKGCGQKNSDHQQ